MTICATAPGKVVLWGEYAVLQGAPALVMAVDRYARCVIHPGGDIWHFSAAGFDAPAAAVTREQLLETATPAPEQVWHLAWHVLRETGDTDVPAGAHVHFDTSSFQDDGGRGKLGLGSSAALCVASYAAFCRLLDRPPDLGTALSAHARFQGGHGSGIDVAAAWHGGLLRFRRASADDPGEATPWTWPAGLCTRFVFSGTSSRTGAHLARLRRWQSDGGHRELEALASASAALFDGRDPMESLAAYAQALWNLDQAADLGVFSDPHRRLRQLAIAAGVVYKPCGAGGGDIGAAFTPDAAAAERFTRSAVDHGFLPLALETASHGIEVTG